MAKMNGQGLEALAVRRTTLTDADKVRYRVYRSPNDYVAVIAESALMAVKVSGVAEPQRIVRDLPSEGVAIHAERMEKGDSGIRVNFAMERVVKETQLNLPPEAPVKAEGAFVPMKLRDLDQKRSRPMRILSPSDLETLVAAAAEPAMAETMPAPSMDAMPEAEAVVPEAAPEVVASDDTLTPEQVADLLKQ